MDASDPEVQRSLEESLKDLAWMRTETKERQTELGKIEKKLVLAHERGDMDESHYQTERISIETSRTAVTDTLRMIQRQHTLITSWLRDAEV